MQKKHLFFLLFTTLVFNINAQDIYINENKSDSINQKSKTIKIEFGTYLDLISENSFNILNENYSKLGSRSLIFNLGLLYKEKISLGLTTMDSKIYGIQRNIHQIYFNYNHSINNDIKIYISQKIPAKNWEELNGNQFKSSRIGFGIKYRIVSYDEFDLFIDINYDQLGFQEGPESNDGTLIIGLSTRINELKYKFK